MSDRPTYSQWPAHFPPNSVTVPSWSALTEIIDLTETTEQSRRPDTLDIIDLTCCEDDTCVFCQQELAELAEAEIDEPVRTLRRHVFSNPGQQEN